MRGFLRTVHNKLHHVFTDESLGKIKTAENGSQKIGELNSPQSVEVSKNAHHLNSLFPELSAEEENANKKPGSAPPKRKTRRTFHATFENQEKPTKIPDEKKQKPTQSAWDTPITIT